MSKEMIVRAWKYPQETRPRGAGGRDLGRQGGKTLKTQLVSRTGFLVAALGLAWSSSAAHAAETDDGRPSVGREEPRGRTPSQFILERAMHPRPSLTGTGESARKNTRAFIDWASSSTTAELEDARQEIAAAASNPEIVRAIIDEARLSYQTEHSRVLISLGLLGEMRNAEGAKFLREFANMPLPTQGTVVEGEILEQTAMATLQAKAVDGLAYMRSPETDAEVLRLAGRHPSRIVRAEAISAYLWNHGDSEEARRALAPHVRPDERIFLDRVRRTSGESAGLFNRKLRAFLQAHPEVIPPAPERLPGPAPEPEQDPNTFNEPPPAL